MSFCGWQWGFPSIFASCMSKHTRIHGLIFIFILYITIMIWYYNHNIILLPSVNTLIAQGMFCGAKYTHHALTPIIKHLITTANKHPGKVIHRKKKEKNITGIQLCISHKIKLPLPKDPLIKVTVLIKAVIRITTINKLIKPASLFPWQLSPWPIQDPTH